MQHTSLPNFHQHLAGEFLKIFNPQSGWQPADPTALSKTGYDLLLLRKNGRVTEKVVGFWVNDIPPSQDTLVRLNILVRKSAGRYAKISAKYLISAQNNPSMPLAGFQFHQVIFPEKNPN